MTDYNISKKNIRDYVEQYNFGQGFANTAKISKELSKMKDLLFEKLSQTFDDCDINESGSLENAKELSIFQEKTNKILLELPSISIFTTTKKNGNIVSHNIEAIIDENKTKNYEAKDLMKFLFQKDNSNELVDSVGLFSYNAANNSMETLKIFDSYYNDNYFKYDENKQSLLKQLREMISSNEISFEDGLSKDEADKLFSLKENVLKAIVNKEVLTDKIKSFFDLDMKIVEHLQDNDFSDFNYLEKNYLNRDDIIIIWNTYKEKTGIFIYNDLISKYENKLISKKQFIKNMKTLLNSYNVDEMSRSDRCERTPYYNILSKIRSGEFDLLEMKIFNMDEYINANFNNSEYRRNLIPGNQIYAYLKHQDFDIKESDIKEFLPEISDNYIAKNTKIQTFNGKQFKVEYQKDKIHIKNENNKKYTVNLEKILKSVKDKEDKDFLITVIKKLPAPVLIDLANNVDKIDVVYDSNAWEGAVATIRLNLAQGRNVKSVESALTHEIGHNVSDNGGIDIGEYRRILNNIPDNAYIEHACDGSSELFAEIYTFLHLGRSHSSDYSIATYFSNQVEPVKKFLENKNNKI